jgi:hypothetical protein
MRILGDGRGGIAVAINSHDEVASPSPDRTGDDEDITMLDTPEI